MLGEETARTLFNTGRRAMALEPLDRERLAVTVP